MKYRCTIARRRKVGEVSSKYGYDKDSKRFEFDIQKDIARSQYLWEEFINFIKSHNATPDEFRNLFARYYDEFIREG